ncbi:hypothetical protein [Modestobacter sp. SYSU DS0290]
MRWLLAVVVVGAGAGWLAAEWLPEPAGTVVLAVICLAVLGLLPLGRFGHRRVAAPAERGPSHPG